MRTITVMGGTLFHVAAAELGDAKLMDRVGRQSKLAKAMRCHSSHVGSPGTANTMPISAQNTMS